MKTKLFAILFIATLCTAGLSSCTEEEIRPNKEEKVQTSGKQAGGQGVEDGF